jgi:hypothetical protein
MCIACIVVYSVYNHNFSLQNRHFIWCICNLTISLPFFLVTFSAPCGLPRHPGGLRYNRVRSRSLGPFFPTVLTLGPPRFSSFPTKIRISAQFSTKRLDLVELKVSIDRAWSIILVYAVHRLAGTKMAWYLRKKSPLGRSIFAVAFCNHQRHTW